MLSLGARYEVIESTAELIAMALSSAAEGEKALAATGAPVGYQPSVRYWRRSTVAPAIAGVLWLFMFAPSVGIVSYALNQFGLEWNHLLDGNQAMALIVMAAVWKQLSYNFLFFLAGLQSIPKSLIEAAAIDGAGPWRRFWTIVFPLLSPTMFFLIVVNIVYAFFDTFGVIHAITRGGPNYATNILVYKVFNDGFINLDLGGSAAQSVILMIVVITLTVVQFRFIERKVHY